MLHYERFTTLTVATIKIAENSRTNASAIRIFWILFSPDEFEWIGFGYCDLPNDFNQFASLTQLTKLHVFGHSISPADVIDMVRRLINLEELAALCWMKKHFPKSLALLKEGRTYWHWNENLIFFLKTIVTKIKEFDWYSINCFVAEICRKFVFCFFLEN